MALREVFSQTTSGKLSCTLPLLGVVESFWGRHIVMSLPITQQYSRLTRRSGFAELQYYVILTLRRALSVVWTTPLVATLGISLTIPLAMVADMLVHGRQYSAVYIIGCIQASYLSYLLLSYLGCSSAVYWCLICYQPCSTISGFCRIYHSEPFR